MEFFTRSGSAARLRSDCVVLGIFDGGSWTPAAEDINRATDGLLGRLKRQGDLPVKPGQSLLIAEPAGIPCKRLLLIGCGDRAKFGLPEYRSALTLAVNRMKAMGNRNAIAALAPADVAPYRLGRHTAEAVENALYVFDELKSGRKTPATKLNKFGLWQAETKDRKGADEGLAHGNAIAEGQKAARRLADLPANVCTPSYLASYARTLAKGNGRIKTTILNESEMKKLRMGALLSVTAGAKEPAKLVVIQYRGAGSDAPVALVGKGITFDTGGVSLKPAPAMDEMKFDMGGAAGVLGAMTALARLELPINVVAVVPTCENMPGGNATRPGDVVRSMSGQTIEILNTDAEGRLILCDALTYVRRFKPSTVIDVATLTGACVIALGHHHTGLMTKTDPLAEELLGAGRAAGDRAWRLPVTAEYDRELKSNFADFPNVTGREGGAITAACFLSRFTDGLDWAHLDIAGTAWRSGSAKGATGRPVPLLVEFLLGRAKRR
jgi:leucyl aminopeptidase